MVRTFALALFATLACTSGSSGSSETIRPPERRCATVPACVRGTYWDDNVCRCIPVEGGLHACDLSRCDEGLTWNPITCTCVAIDAGAHDAAPP
jgi:hypothetical protein